MQKHYKITMPFYYSFLMNNFYSYIIITKHCVYIHLVSIFVYPHKIFMCTCINTYNKKVSKFPYDLPSSYHYTNRSQFLEMEIEATKHVISSNFPPT